MKRHLSSLLLFFVFVLCRAQLTLSDSIQISLLTVDPGPEAYECFGHTGIRIKDLQTKKDIVFHYGVYDYSEPYFLWHFVLGECNYKMGAVYTSHFFQEYRERHLNVTEQILRLDSVQTKNLVQALLINYQPENRNYRYNYFFDNCSTRPYSIFNKWVDIQYDTTWIDKQSLRDMVREMAGASSWLDFGIALTIAGRADQPTPFTEQMFLPKYLCKALDNASVQQQPFVKEKHIHSFTPSSSPKSNGGGLLSPVSICWFYLLIGLVLSYYQIKVKNRSKAAQRMLLSFDISWLILTGIAGVIVWFLNFFSLHPAVDNNINCWWLLPTNLLFATIIGIKKAEKVRHIYFFIIFAAEFIYLLLLTQGQYCHPAFIPLLIVIASRSFLGYIESKHPSK
ncbi:MAG: DUF4105 domain-containing protein [Bacteroidales bacterium]|nr:DUF4105 domain-containing protein [Bacteroidales bacterium]